MTFHVLTRDIEAGLLVCMRLATAVAAANLVTLTTALEDMLDVMERLMARLFIGRQDPTPALPLSVTLVIRFIPELTRKGGTLIEAWRARSTKKFSWKLLLPFALLALDDAEQVAEALKHGVVWNRHLFEYSKTTELGGRTYGTQSHSNRIVRCADRSTGADPEIYPAAGRTDHRSELGHHAGGHCFVGQNAAHWP